MNFSPWRHNDVNAQYNNFYNISYNSVLDFVSNVAPTTTKIYQNIALESTDIWEVDITTRNGQRTNVNLVDFTGGGNFVWEEGHGTKENVHHAAIMGDLNTPNMISPNMAKIEGNRMRDTSSTFRLILPEPASQQENVLFSVKIGFTPSGSPNLLGNQ